jgi:hypothetical protein
MIGKYKNTFLGPPFLQFLLQFLSSPPSFLRWNQPSPQIGHFSRSSHLGPQYRMQSFNLLVIQIKCSILQKLIVHDHNYLQCLLLLSHCRVSLLCSLPIVLVQLQVILFILPHPLLHLLGSNILLHATAEGTTIRTPG